MTRAVLRVGKEENLRIGGCAILVLVGTRICGWMRPSAMQMSKGVQMGHMSMPRKGAESVLTIARNVAQKPTVSDAMHIQALLYYRMRAV